MKRTQKNALYCISRSWYVIVIAIVFISSFPLSVASSQSLPPGGYPGGSYNNCNPYSVSAPRLVTDKNTQSMVTGKVPETTKQWDEIDKATTFITQLVVKVETDQNGDAARLVGYLTSPAVFGMCATPAEGKIPVLYIVDGADDMTNEQLQASFFPICTDLMSDMNSELITGGFGLWTMYGLCAAMAIGSTQMVCATLGPQWIAFLQAKSVWHFENQRPVVGQIYYTAAIRIQAALLGWCVSKGVI